MMTESARIEAAVMLPHSRRIRRFEVSEQLTCCGCSGRRRMGKRKLTDPFY